MNPPQPNDAVAEQIRLYGEPLAQVFGRVLTAFGIPQSRLAEVIGLSAPMLSQLASGRRVKISNPAVYGRLLRLDELARRPEVANGDPAARTAGLAEVAASQPSLTTRSSGPDVDLDALATALAQLAPATVLLDLAARCPEPRLAGVLQRGAAVAGAPSAGPV
ncbi:DNA-binding protein [Jatrophihabitans sp. YIM 134969]